MPQAKIAFILILVLSFILSLIPYILPVPENTNSPTKFRFDIAALLFISLERVGGGIIFLLGLKGFKTEFKQVYYLICAGVVLNGIFSLAYPISRYINEWQSWFMLYAGDLPTMLGFVIIYFGVRKFAILMGLRNFYTSYTKLLPILTVALLILWFLPHQPPYSGTEVEFDSMHGTLAIEMFFSFISAWLVLRIRKVANPVFAHALWWFSLALIIDSLACAYYITYNYILFPPWLPEESIAVLFLVCGMIFLIAGYSFNTMKVPVDNTSNQKKESSLIDIIVYTANLASKLQDINAYLEPMRFITAKLEKGQQPSPEQEKELVKVYQNIEEYLVTKEPLKNYTKEGLRADIVSKFGRIPS